MLILFSCDCLISITYLHYFYSRPLSVVPAVILVELGSISQYFGFLGHAFFFFFKLKLAAQSRCLQVVSLLPRVSGQQSQSLQKVLYPHPHVPRATHSCQAAWSSPHCWGIQLPPGSGKRQRQVCKPRYRLLLIGSKKQAWRHFSTSTFNGSWIKNKTTKASHPLLPFLV